MANALWPLQASPGVEMEANKWRGGATLSSDVLPPVMAVVSTYIKKRICRHTFCTCPVVFVVIPGRC